MVIFHSYVSLPEGNILQHAAAQNHFCNLKSSNPNTWQPKSGHLFRDGDAVHGTTLHGTLGRINLNKPKNIPNSVELSIVQKNAIHNIHKLTRQNCETMKQIFICIRLTITKRIWTKMLESFNWLFCWPHDACSTISTIFLVGTNVQNGQTTHSHTAMFSKMCTQTIPFYSILFHTLHMRIGQKLLVGLCGAFICGAFSICVVTSLLGISGTHPEQQPELPAL